ncbi:HAMP domain-containing histidine kinase [Bacteroides sp. OttesenSCG-928-J23]|nr:HAMP domain-containing histidine kinase [Bacteroides sp. OttesenSCG-928-N06]MDL2247920.1 HAMP domain-containing histidine kinase [Bacteroides sp. OttesenSCG-928-J23]
MEKRIRIVWILSLVSALLLIGVQAYWLFNQYQFVLDGYSEELAGGILNAANNEYRLRKKEDETNYLYIINTNREYVQKSSTEKTDNNHFSFALTRNSFQADNKTDTFLIDSIRKEALRQTATLLDSINGKVQGQMENTGRVLDLSLSIDPNLSQDSIQRFLDMALTNSSIPFRAERFDSLLNADMPEHSFQLYDWPETDSIYRSSWRRTGSITHPRLRVAYAYSPFQKLGIIIESPVPTQPLFARMAVQLLLAFGLILLLIGCLIFQIRTILKQKKIGELRQNFVNTMIHELKRPVQTLKTFISFLGDKDMRSDEVLTGQVVQDSMFELDNLSAYLNKLKDMVRADSENAPLNLTCFDLRELTEKVVRLIHIPTGKQVEFSKYFDMESPMIEADPIHLANVFSNLIENAIKYSGDKVHIEIKARKKGNELWLTVSDNGIGIPVVEQERVFVKFYRGTNLPDNNIPGLGLGLSYVKLISEAHQGYVSLQSHLGRGTTVTLFLPQ